MGQCAAEMVAARMFNQRAGSAIEVVHGAVTTGTNWRFMTLCPLFPLPLPLPSSRFPLPSLPSALLRGPAGELARQTEDPTVLGDALERRTLDETAAAALPN